MHGKTIIHPADQPKPSKLKRIAIGLLLFTILTAFVAAMVPVVLDGIEREDQWRKERLCRIYGVCDPKAGP